VYRARSGTRSDDTTRRLADTTALVRADFDARKPDTVAMIAVPRTPRTEIYLSEHGKPAGELVINPFLPSPDEWGVTTDGSIAVVRAIDYHIDWLYADGTRASTPKMPFDWRRLTDADKRARIDSLKHMIDSVNATGRPYGLVLSFCSALRRGATDAERAAQCAADRAAGRVVRDSVVPSVSFLPLNEVPDYVSAVRPGSVKPDRQNNLWILPTTTLSAAGGGLLYDVVNTRGEIIERVQLPTGRNIAGFGAQGELYLVSGDRQTGYVIEMTRVLRDLEREP
jgi:hypothetical protein